MWQVSHAHGEKGRGMSRLRAFRRSLLVGAVAALTLGGAMTALSGGAGAAAPLGQAAASGTVIKVNPQAGSLSLGIALGESLTNYQNNVAIAESRGVDL